MTTLTRFNPQRTLGTLQNEVDRLFGQFFPLQDSWTEEEDGTKSYVWSPRVDVAETDEGFVLQFDLPGLTRDDVQVSVEDQSLTISGERAMNEEQKGRHYRRIERSYGRFYRSFNLGEAVDAEHITAHFEHGVLSVNVPKTEKSKPRTIEIS